MQKKLPQINTVTVAVIVAVVAVVVLVVVVVLAGLSMTLMSGAEVANGVVKMNHSS